MRAVIQRVKRAWVEVDGVRVGSIAEGLLVYLGIEQSDQETDLNYICQKVVGLRVFEDTSGKMNLSVRDAKGRILLVSQFTLFGDCRKGKRPSFTEAACAEKAKQFFDLVAARLKEHRVEVETGIFRETMEVYSVNAGPVTLLLDSRKLF